MHTLTDKIRHKTHSALMQDITLVHQTQCINTHEETAHTQRFLFLIFFYPFRRTPPKANEDELWRDTQAAIVQVA